MTETLAAFLSILSLWALARFDNSRSWFNAALAGGAIGLGILCRPTFLPWLGLIAFSFLLFKGRQWAHRSNFDFGWRLANIFALVMGAATILTPWVVRNYRVFDKPIATTTHGGYTLLLGNNPEFYIWLGSHDELPWDGARLEAWIYRNSPIFPPGVDFREIRFDEFCYEAAYRTMRDDPLMATNACFYRIGQLWSPLPNNLTEDESISRRLLRYATCAWYVGVYLLAGCGIWRLIRERGTPPTAFPTAPWIWGVLLCVAFTSVHTFYWTNLRMRAPLMPFVAIVAAAAIRPRARN